MEIGGRKAYVRFHETIFPQKYGTFPGSEIFLRMVSFILWK